MQGVAKPSYRAFELLHRLGVDAMPVSGTHDTVDVWVVRAGAAAMVLMTNYALPRHTIGTETVDIRLTACPAPQNVYTERIDDDHANSKRLWIEMGSPSLPTPRQVEHLHTASRMTREPLHWTFDGDVLHLVVPMPPQGIAAVTIDFAPPASVETRSDG